MSSSTNKAKAINVKSLSIQHNTDRTVLAQWEWSDSNNRTHLDHYEYKWYYTAGDAWLDGGSGSSNLRAVTFDPPSQAVKVQFKVRPISTKKTIKVKKESTTNTYTDSLTTAPTATPFQSGLDSILGNPLLTNNNITSGTASQFISLLDSKSLTSKFYTALRDYIKAAGLSNGKDYLGQSPNWYQGVLTNQGEFIYISDINSVSDIQTCLQKGWLTSKNIKSVLEYMSDSESKYGSASGSSNQQQSGTQKSKTYTYEDKQVDWFSSSWSKVKTFRIPSSQQITYPALPEVPTILRVWNGSSIQVGGQITDPNTKYITLVILKDEGRNDKDKGGSVNIKVVNGQWSWTGYKSSKPSITKGHSYKFKARAASGEPGKKGTHYSNGDNDQSPYTGWSKIVSTGEISMKTIRGSDGLLPLKMLDIDNGDNGYTIQVSWRVPDMASLIDKYQIQYTTDKLYFDNSASMVTPVETESNKPSISSCILDPLSADTYYVRIRAIDTNGGYGAWSNIRSITVGEAPSAPSVWQTSSAVKRNKHVDLQFTHNSVDGSALKSYIIEYCVDGTIAGDFANISSEDGWGTHPYGWYKFDVQNYDATSENVTQIKRIYPFELANGGNDLDNEESRTFIFRWRVKTRGAFNTWSPWSSINTITIMPENSLGISLKHGNTVLDEAEDSQFARYSSDNTVYDLSVMPFKVSCVYEGASWIERQITITALESYDTYVGAEIKTIRKGEVIFKNFVSNSNANSTYNSYNLNLTAGDITIENTVSYLVNVTYVDIYGNTTTKKEAFTANFGDETVPFLDVVIRYTSGTAFYTEITSSAYTIEIDDNTGESYNNYWNKYLIDVYRVMVDGSLVRITDEAAPNTSTVTDPHPHMDYARYRMVITDSETGQQYCEDVIGSYIGKPGLIIQWDEHYDSYDNPYIYELESYDLPSDYSWNGAAVHLLYNITKTEERNLDVELVKYIGRENPVSYYGTQINETATWKTEIPKTDTDILEGIRHLGRYAGDVYVRESSGNGYWANVKVSFSDDYDKVVIPVSFKITRVEGGA